MFDRAPPENLDVRISELLVATPDAADPLLAPQVQQVLSLLRERMHMDLAFVSEFEGGRQVLRRIDQADDLHIPEGHVNALEDSWCKHVVDHRIPELVPDMQALVDQGTVPAGGMQVGTYMSTPVVLPDGRIYGTLCCLSRHVQGDIGELDLKRLRSTAQLLGVKLGAAPAAQTPTDVPPAAAAAPAWSLQPTPAPRR